MWYVIPEVTSCVFVFIGPVFLTVLLVSSRHGWYHRSDHACVTWINSSRDISFLLVQILARDHGSLGLSVWSIDATISPIFSSFSVSLCVGAPYFCGGSVILLPTGWFIFVLVHDLQPWDHSTCGCLTTPQPTRSRLMLSVIWEYVSDNICENVCVRRYILSTAGQDLHEECFSIYSSCDVFFYRALLIVAMQFIGSCLLTSSRRLLLCYWATPVGSSSATSPSFSRRCFSGGFMTTSSTTVLWSGVSSWQHPPRRFLCGGY